MAMLPRTVQDQLTRIKKNIKTSYDYFKPNYDRFNEFRRFVFDTALREEDVNLLLTLSKPQLEFNVVEAYISRLLGEFAKQEPSIEVSADDEMQVDTATVRIVEDYIRHDFYDAKNHHPKYEIYKDLLSGGFSTAKVYTEYTHSKSFDQVIKFDRAFDPTLCGFDPLARYSHKGDGRYCFELFPKEKEDFMEEYPEMDISNISYTRSMEGFNWSYLNNATPIIMIADYYEKKKKRVKIVKTTEGKVMTMKEYEAGLRAWDGFAQYPAIVDRPRWTEFETIVRYRIIENQILEYVETDFQHFPLVFVDGNSLMIKTPKNGNVRQMTRPYVFHAKGAQRLKNFSGITLANGIENMVQHKFMISKEALPKQADFQQAYKDYQKANLLVYNAYDEKNPQKPLEPPKEISPVPMPPEVTNAFTGADSVIQAILGNYDAALGINDNQLSGLAIIEGATQSNSAAMPYVIGFLQGLQRIAEIYVDLLPKYYKTKRTIPIMNKENKRDYVKINQDNGIRLYYDENALNVKVEAGVNFQIQKNRALSQIIALMQASDQFKAFMNEKGMPVLLDNIEIRGIDQIKILAEDWMKEQAEMKAKMANMPNPEMMKAQAEMAKIQAKGQEVQAKTQIEMMKLQAEREKAISDSFIARDENKTERLRAHAEVMSKSIELEMAKTDQRHKHLKEGVDTLLAHKDMEHRHKQAEKEVTTSAKF